jgi:hypothetical protein
MVTEKNIVRLKISYPPLSLLALLFIVSILFKLGKDNFAAQVFPIIFVFIGILVIAFGSFFDFGANQYLQNLIISKSKLSEKDVLSINREQLVMNIIYVIIGIAYILSGIFLTFIYKII